MNIYLDKIQVTVFRGVVIQTKNVGSKVKNLKLYKIMFFYPKLSWGFARNILAQQAEKP